MSNKIEINGVKLAYQLSGKSGDLLVLVHGSWVDRHVWDAIVPALAQDFRVLTYDRRGHSESERPGGQGTIHEDVADLAGLIEALDLAPAHIIGNSLGGSIALRLACQRPDLFYSLSANEPPLVGLLADEPALSDALQAMQGRFAAVARLIEAGNLEEAACQFVETVVFGPGMWEGLPPRLQQTVTYNAPTFLDEFRDPDAFTIDLACMRDFDAPVLLTRGERGVPFAQAVMARLASVLPQAEERTLAGADHAPMMSQPAAYVDIIREFVKTAVADPQPAR